MSTCSMSYTAGGMNLIAIDHMNPFDFEKYMNTFFLLL